MNSRVTSFKMRELFPLGEGGMGVTYLGCAKGAGGFERLIAIKRLHEHLQKDEEARTRLLFEAELAGCVQHANVVGVQHVDQDERGAFLVLDYVDGGPLSQLLKVCRPARLPMDITLRVAIDCLAGLEAIHTAENYRGEPLHILHRDTSPDNVLIGLDGTARLTDFGIARAKHHPTLTAPTQLVGKLSFMAPEYVDKRDLGPPLDIYSMGVMLWMLLTGESPWKGLEEAQLLARLLTSGVPPLPQEFSIDPELRKIVTRATALNPDERYGSAAEMAAALEQFGRRHPIATRGEVAHFTKTKLDPSTSERRLKAAKMLNVESVRPHELSVQRPSSTRIKLPASVAWSSRENIPTATYGVLESATASYSPETLDALAQLSRGAVPEPKTKRSFLTRDVETLSRPELPLFESDVPLSAPAPIPADTLRSRRARTWSPIWLTALVGGVSAAIGLAVAASTPEAASDLPITQASALGAPVLASTQAARPTGDAQGDTDLQNAAPAAAHTSAQHANQARTSEQRKPSTLETRPVKAPEQTAPSVAPELPPTTEANEPSKVAEQSAPSQATGAPESPAKAEAETPAETEAPAQADRAPTVALRAAPAAPARSETSRSRPEDEGEIVFRNPYRAEK